MQKHENPNIRDVCVDVDTFMIIGRMVLLNCCGAAAAGVYIDSGAGAGRSRAPGTSRTLTASGISEYQRHNTTPRGLCAHNKWLPQPDTYSNCNAILCFNK